MKFDFESKNRLLNNRYLSSIFLAIVCVLLYGRTLGYSYVWDDVSIFLNKNSLVVDPLSWNLLTTPILPNTSYMRPLVMLTWWLEFKAVGQHPALSHGINVAIFSVNVLLVRALAERILESTKSQRSIQFLATLAALMYAIHPALVESVAWVSGRFDLLCTTGVLGAAWCFAKTDLSPWVRVLGVCLFTLIALMSKELGIVTPIILVCIWMSMHSNSSEKFIVNFIHMLKVERHIWISLVFILISYFIIRDLSMSGIYHRSANFEYYRQILSSALPIETLQFYGRIFIFPLNYIDTFYPVRETPATFGIYLTNIVTIILVLIVIFSAIRKMQTWAWLMIAAFVGISLVLHLIPMTIAGNIAQDRFLTLPLAFLCIAVVSFPWDRFLNNFGVSSFLKGGLSVLFGAWLLISLSVTLSATPKWSSDLNLWRRAYQMQPNVLAVRMGYLYGTLAEGRLDLAREVLEKLKEKNGGLGIADQYFYASLLLAEGDSESVKYFEGILLAFPKDKDGNLLPDSVKLPNFSENVYSQYARSKLIFDGDLSVALRFINDAQRIMGKGRQAYAAYTKVAILYAMDDSVQADLLLKKLRSEYHFDGERLEDNMKSDINAYCKLARVRNMTSPKICQTELQLGK
ncbi:tetratricopeptide (TPR) repeat protein [Comamonas odontotermitis]|uniref:Tetratricopeptide (TPR) repeat protein n=1 Tax=Comamonas odontotermitis TaxID=379895 RepID=A0ABR6RAM2_9BURK|nr:hypothetical protein [Comamonas odontotermitis]MBB6576198.1 tetratricopeptide (TPR) repeat protein [Comamonas odontotermitis]